MSTRKKKSKILLKHDTTMTAIKFEKYIFRIQRYIPNTHDLQETFFFLLTNQKKNVVYIMDGYAYSLQFTYIHC